MKCTKLAVTGLSCIVLAILYLLEVLVAEFKQNLASSRDELWCRASMNMITVTYTLHRVLVYTFIILRLEILNKSHFLSSRIILAAKAVVGVSGTFMVVSTIVFTKGVLDQDFQCGFEVEANKDWILAVMVMIDFSICVSGTFLFIRPMWRVLRGSEDSSLRNTIRTTQIWSTVCLVSTFLVLLIIVVIDGGAAFVVFDCSITSLSLVIMMSPTDSQSKDPPSKAAILEIDQSFRPKKHSSDLSQVDLSDISINMQFKSTSSCTI